jgi:hypothetical protein
MSALLKQYGDAKGILLMNQSVREDRFIPEEAQGRDRLYEDVEESVLLYYKAQKVQGLTAPAGSRRGRVDA